VAGVFSIGNGAAKVRGCRTMSGACMAVFQTAEGFRLFSGEKADQEHMLLHFENM
jgi:shikimate dehydrogenase